MDCRICLDWSGLVVSFWGGKGKRCSRAASNATLGVGIVGGIVDDIVYGIVGGNCLGFDGVGLLIVLHVHEIAMGILNGYRGAYLGKQHLLMVELDS